MMMRDGLMKLRCSEMSINRNEYKYICPNQKDKLGRADYGNDFSNALYYHTIDFFGILQYIFP